MALWVFDYKCKYSDRVVFWIDDQMYTRVIPQSLSSNVVSKKPLLFRELWRQADFPLVVSNEIPGDALPRTEILFERDAGANNNPEPTSVADDLLAPAKGGRTVWILDVKDDYEGAELRIWGKLLVKRILAIKKLLIKNNVTRQEHYLALLSQLDESKLDELCDLFVGEFPNDFLVDWPGPQSGLKEATFPQSSIEDLQEKIMAWMTT